MLQACSAPKIKDNQAKALVIIKANTSKASTSKAREVRLRTSKGSQVDRTSFVTIVLPPRRMATT